MNFVCNVQITATATGFAQVKGGSCGPEIMAGVTTGPFRRVAGSQVQDVTQCNVQAVLALDRAGFPFNITDSFQTAQLANEELN